MRIKRKNLIIAGIIFGIILILGLIFMLQSLLKAPPTPYQDINSTRPILGNPAAKVKVVEFSDLQCPACKTASSYPQRLINEFGNSISVEFKPFPLSFHQYAYKAAVGAECANDEGKFWEFIEICFINQPALTVNNLKGYAEKIGLDTASFNACIDSASKDEIIDSYIREGYSLNIPGTPTFIVNGKMITTISYDDIAAEIKAQLGTN
jgi:protein-disulfide isomerase